MTKGSRNQFLWYRIKDGARDWTQWYKFTLKPSPIKDQYYYVTDSGRDRIFTINGSVMSYNQRRSQGGTIAKTLTRVDARQDKGVVFAN